jgi:uncharacterized protein YndB with AHSA1/START domain
MSLYERALAAFRSGATDEASGFADELIAASRTSGDLVGEIDGLCMLSRVALRRGELQRVAELAEKARDLALQSKEGKLERMPLHLQAVAARMQGDFRLARQLYRQSIQLNRQLREERMVAAEHRNLAYVELHDGNATEARELFSTSASLARECGYEALEPYLLLDSAVLALETGDASRAAQLLKGTDARFEAAGQIPDPDDAAELKWLRSRLQTKEQEMTGNAPGGGRILGSLRSADGKGVVRIEDRYDTDIDDLWSALTDPGRLAHSYGEVEGDLRLGGEFRLRIEADGWDGTGRVEACERPRRLLVTTRETDESWRKGRGAEPFDEAIEATLTADGGQTMLVIEIRGLPLDTIAFYGAGWQIHAENLATYLAGRERGDTEARWDELVPAYQNLAANLS